MVFSATLALDASAAQTLTTELDSAPDGDEDAGGAEAAVEGGAEGDDDAEGAAASNVDREAAPTKGKGDPKDKPRDGRAARGGRNVVKRKKRGARETVLGTEAPVGCACSC